MTTDRQMAVTYIAQEEVIAALYGIGELDLAARLERCTTARRERRGGDVCLPGSRSRRNDANVHGSDGAERLDELDPARFWR